ncbi:MAG: Periplasmic thiol:disulfide interchange protein DsbA [Labilithrix sp.]|nr:Periplasmic thiol:disulfide interchange protein DsbA [Labilithrix sp.]
MALKALVVGIVGFISLSQSMCGKSTTAEDPAKDKPTPEVALEGVDTSALTPREKKEFGTYVSEFLSPCQNVPVSIAQCIQEKRACDRCQPAAKYVLRGVKDGMTRDQVEKAYKGRFDPSGVKNVPIDGSPVRGPESAPVTIVEFADFECPHCGEVAPIIDKVLEAHKNEVRFAFKFYPLPSHPHAEIAARAAAASMGQGKFWEMHHALFTNQRHLEQTDLDSYAKELGIDVSRFHADMQSNQTSDRIAKDKKLGEDLMIAGTPSIYINGRVYDGHQELGEWVTQELATIKAGGGSAPAPSASPSAAASASAGGPAPKK